MSDKRGISVFEILAIPFLAAAMFLFWLHDKFFGTKSY